MCKVCFLYIMCQVHEDFHSELLDDYLNSGVVYKDANQHKWAHKYTYNGKRK